MKLSYWVILLIYYLFLVLGFSKALGAFPGESGKQVIQNSIVRYTLSTFIALVLYYYTSYYIIKWWMLDDPKETVVETSETSGTAGS